MFGGFPCNNGAPNNPEYVDLSRNFTMDPRNHAFLPCDLCQARKLKCNGDLYGCASCRATSNACTYRSSPAFTSPSSLCQRPAWSVPDFSAPPPAKRHQTGHPGNVNIRPAPSAVPAFAAPSMMPRPPPLDLNSRTPMPITPPGAAFINPPQDWAEFCNMNPKPYQGLNINLGATAPCPSMMPSLMPSLPLLPCSSPSSPSTASSVTEESDSECSSLALTTPANATPQNPLDNRYRRCECVRSLADTLEKISPGDIDISKSIEDTAEVDEMLRDLHECVETCKRVVACSLCNVCIRNSMLVITVFQQLLRLSSDLCHHALIAQKKSKAAPPRPVSSDGSQSPGEGIARYQVQVATVCLQFIHGLVGMHLKHVHQFLGILRHRFGKKAKASKVLEEVIRSAHKIDEMLDEFKANETANLSQGRDK
ncbi:hypothetical protein BO71DRAFT_386542 [Aspergillus ellipticus CBS 707.79]|uniref:Zn(2)-C6 fungal-type domain-containing protein n=1 Tax=Aspergillus ellipticus CBS 707.79 TaxID=1448320 RepID=A0A319EJ77_9EURO|nr:hypothetical protein BO71DRAFT_386542 [Aspergillus ellipticus CBS 707.79]